MTPWARCRAWLAPALDGVSEGELIADLKSGTAQLWIDRSAAMVTQVIEQAGQRSLHVWLAGGELAGVLRLKPEAERWARSIGCSSITLLGRRGWGRVLRGDGFVLFGEELRKEL